MTKTKTKTKTTKTRPGQWIDLIVDSVGCFVRLETTDGLYREGKLTGLRMREIEINGIGRDYPNAIELNGDPNDYIDFVLVLRIDIDPCRS